MNRGDRRELIVMDDADRQRFVDTLGEACAKAAPGHLARNQGLVRAMGPCFGGTLLHHAETLSLLRSLSRSVFHDCRSGLLRCTGKATSPVPG
jgi:hypothetical protein